MSLKLREMKHLTNPKLIIIGHRGHGKKTAVKLLHAIFGLNGISANYFANVQFVYPLLKDRYDYQSLEECYRDRYNHQEEWQEIIKRFNVHDPTRLAKGIFNRHDIYYGVKDIEEFTVLKNHKLFHYALWIDASERAAIDDKLNCTVEIKDADYIIDNNEPIYYMAQQLIDLILTLYPKFC